MGRSQSADKGFSLLEAIVAVAVMAVGTVFMLRAFAVSLDAVRRAGDTGFACSLAEEKIWEAAFRQMRSTEPIARITGSEKSGDKNFSWECESDKPATAGPFELSVQISWDKSRLEVGTRVLGSL